MGKQQPHRVAEDITKMNVDRPRGPVEIHVGVEIHPGIQEHLQGGEARLVNGEALVGDDGVVDQSGQIDGPYGYAAHIRIPQDVVEVVRGVGTGDDRLEHVQPAGQAGIVFPLLFQNHVSDLIGMQLFASGEGT